MPKITLKMDKNQKNTDENSRLRARQLYEQGAEAWKYGDRAKAMTLYAKSAEIDPEGPGVQALKMTNEIMDFFDPNQLNP